MIDRISRIILLSLMVLIVTTSQGGCESRKKAEVATFYPQSFADLAAKVMPAVVNVSTTSTVRVPNNPLLQFFGPEEDNPLAEFFRRKPDNSPERKMKQKSLGSGFIVDKNGLILTNNHVLDNAEDIRVKITDGREFKAKVIGRDAKTDLALIKISSPFENLPTLSLGDSDRIRVGDWALAIGNPFGLEQSVTQGIISATGRVIGSGPYDNFLQTDAPINPGNSGGPLVNMKGEVIGITTIIVSGGQGVGFAVPSSLAKVVMKQLKEKGKVVRGWIGVSIQPVTPGIARAFALKEARGALIGDVVVGSPADKAGLKGGDIILSFDGKEIKNANDLPRLVAATPVGKKVAVAAVREGKELNLDLTVGELAEEKGAPLPQATLQGFGIKVSDLTPEIQQQLKTEEKTGVVVVGVEPGSLAQEAGIQVGDMVREVNRKKVKSVAEYQALLKSLPKGEPILLLMKRGKQTFYVSLE